MDDYSLVIDSDRSPGELSLAILTVQSAMISYLIVITMAPLGRNIRFNSINPKSSRCRMCVKAEPPLDEREFSVFKWQVGVDCTGGKMKQGENCFSASSRNPWRA